MSNQDGTPASIIGMCATAILMWISHITASEFLTWVGIGAGLSTIAVNLKNYFKKK
jgi:sorbitol-specific phosphotransferase system component IIC